MDDQSSVTSVADPFGFRRHRVAGGLPVAALPSKENLRNIQSVPSAQNKPNFLQNRSSFKPREVPLQNAKPLAAVHHESNDSASFGASIGQRNTDPTYTQDSLRSRRPTIVSATSTTSPLLSPYPQANAALSTITTRTAKPAGRSQLRSTALASRNFNQMNQHGLFRDDSPSAPVPPTPLAWEDTVNAPTSSPGNTTISQLSVSPDIRRVTPSIFGSDMERNSHLDGEVSQFHGSLQRSHYRSRPTDLPPTAEASSSPADTSVVSLGASRLQQKRLHQVQSELSRAQEEVRHLRDEAAAAVVQREQETHQRRQLERQLENLLQQQRESQKQQDERDNLNNGPSAEELVAWETALELKAAALDREQERLESRENDWNELQDELIALEEEHQQREARLVEWQEQIQTAEQALRQERSQLRKEQEAQNERIQQEKDQIASQQRRLLGTEQRLDAQALAIQERTQQLDAKQTQLSQLESRVQKDQQELLTATEELENQTSREHAKFQQMQDEMKDMLERRRVEERALERSIQQRQKFEQETDEIKAQAEQTQSNVSAHMRNAQSELERVQTQVKELRGELAALQQRKQNVLDADEARRKAVVAETAKADQNLTAVLQQLEVAQRERSSVAAALAEQQRELDNVKQHMAREETKWHAERVELDDRASKLNQLREAATKEAKDIVAEAELRANRIAQTTIDDSKAMTQELEQQRLALNEKMRTYERDQEVLQRDSDAHQKSLAEFNKRVHDFMAVEGREKLLREELDLKVKRLTSLVQKERAEHSKEVQRLEQTIRTHQAESEHNRSRLSKRLAEVEAERDEMNADSSTLRQCIMDRERDIESLQGDLKSLRDELTNAQHQANELLERESRSRASNNDLHQLKRFMERLEAQSAVLEQQEQHCKQMSLDLETREQEYQRDLTALSEERQKMLQACKQATEEQRAAILARLSQPWRREQESISAAFSRFVRSTLTDIVGQRGDDAVFTDQLVDMETQISTLEEQRDEANRACLEQERKCREGLERERNSKRDLDRQLREQRRKEQELYQDIERLSKEKEHYRRQSLSSTQTKADAEGLAAALEEREARIKQKEAELEEMEQSIRDQEGQIAEANDRIRRMAALLRKKETDLEDKEARLAATASNLGSDNYMFRFDHDDINGSA
jgi:hypothetical protein